MKKYKAKGKYREEEISVSDVQDMKQREAIFGLTVGMNFKSIYEQNKEIRRQKIEEAKELTKYEGKVPIN